MADRKERRGAAFTLLELMVTLVLLAMVSAVSVVAIRGPLARAATERAISQIIASEAKERFAARQHPDLGRLVHASANRIDFHLSERSLVMPRGLEIAGLSVVTANRMVARSEVPFAISGQSPTFVIELKRSSQSRDWLVFLGISGQAIHLQNEGELRTLLSLRES